LFLFDGEEKDGGGMCRFFMRVPRLAACAFSLSLSLFSPSDKSKVKFLRFTFWIFPKSLASFSSLYHHIYSAQNHRHDSRRIARQGKDAENGSCVQKRRFHGASRTDNDNNNKNGTISDSKIQHVRGE
jgi:hypothetical protein